MKVGPYDKALHHEIFSACKAAGNEAYEMLFLTPPNLVSRRNERERCFTLKGEWAESLGITLWDGTDAATRSDYPTRVEEHRLFQYDSCRGLEGWSVVCLNLDDFFEYKQRTYRDEPAEGQLALRSAEDSARLFAARWVMVPMTRAVDTLVLIIRRPDSYIGKLLHNISQTMPDIVEWKPSMSEEMRVCANRSG